MNFIARFMQGRYGADQFNLALLILGILINFAVRFTGIPLLIFLAYPPFLFAIYRMFSKNLERRRRENAWFLRLWSPVWGGVKRGITMLRQSKNYRFFKCPSCKTTVRVPKGKGVIEINCPACHTKFRKKS
jgi:hypothetical protein